MKIFYQCECCNGFGTNKAKISRHEKICWIRENLLDELDQMSFEDKLFEKWNVKTPEELADKFRELLAQAEYLVDRLANLLTDDDKEIIPADEITPNQKPKKIPIPPYTIKRDRI